MSKVRVLQPVLLIRIRRIRMFWGLLNPDPSIIKQKYWEKPWFLLFCDFFLTFYLWKMMSVYLQKIISRITFFKLVFCLRLEDQWRKQQDLDLLGRGMVPRIRIHTRMSWIRKTACNTMELIPVEGYHLKYIFPRTWPLKTCGNRRGAFLWNSVAQQYLPFESSEAK